MDSQRQDAEITAALAALREGRADAHEHLMRLVYRELHALAARQCGRNSLSQSLQPTALVHEAYMRLFGKEGAPSFENRAHFFWAAARAMRDLLVENARARQRIKRGGDRSRVALTPEMAVVEAQGTDLLAIDEALLALQAAAPREAGVVALRFYAGLEHAEIASVLGVGEATVRRDWAYAKAWLHRYLLRQPGSGAEPAANS